MKKAVKNAAKNAPTKAGKKAAPRVARKAATKADNTASAEIVPSAQHDWFIQSLVNIATVAPLSFGVTLQVSGLLVSGYLVSGKAYFEAIGEQIVGGFAQNAALADEMRKMFATFESAYPSDPSQTDRPVPQFIHLQNARFYSTDGKPVPSDEGVWWRGRISEISGVVVGILDVSQ